MKELKKYGLESSIGESENLESKKFRRSQNEWGYGHGSLPEIEIRPSGHGSSSDSDSWNSSGINPDTGGNLGGNIKETCKRTSMMSKVYRIAFILLCLLIPAIQSCRQEAEKEISAEFQTKVLSERDRAGLSLSPMLNNRDFEHVLPLLDSLLGVYPDDPQFHFVKGWVYDMQGDSLRARAAYSRSLCIYDSLIADRPNLSDMINRAYIVQILYGGEACNQALDEIQSQSFTCSASDSVTIQLMREDVLNIEELSFEELCNDTASKNR